MYLDGSPTIDSQDTTHFTPPVANCSCFPKGYVVYYDKRTEPIPQNSYDANHMAMSVQSPQNGADTCPNPCVASGNVFYVRNGTDSIAFDLDIHPFCDSTGKEQELRQKDTLV